MGVFLELSDTVAFSGRCDLGIVLILPFAYWRLRIKTGDIPMG